MHKSELILWTKSATLGLIIIGLSYLYNGLQLSLWNPFVLNKALAAAAIIMVNLSFVVSGTSYFWGLGRKYMGYRKSAGVTGFAIALVHVSASAWLYTESVIWKELLQTYPVANIPALFAIFIFTMMVAVSNWGMPRRLGAVTWRRLLRVGYIAILLITFHMAIHSWGTWAAWFSSFDPILPPLSLIVFAFSLFTLGLRISLFFALRKKAQQATPPPPTTT